MSEGSLGERCILRPVLQLRLPDGVETVLTPGVAPGIEALMLSWRQQHGPDAPVSCHIGPAADGPRKPKAQALLTRLFSANNTLVLLELPVEERSAATDWLAWAEQTDVALRMKRVAGVSTVYDITQNSEPLFLLGSAEVEPPALHRALADFPAGDVQHARGKAWSPAVLQALFKVLETWDIQNYELDFAVHLTWAEDQASDVFMPEFPAFLTAEVQKSLSIHRDGALAIACFPQIGLFPEAERQQVLGSFANTAPEELVAAMPQLAVRYAVRALRAFLQQPACRPCFHLRTCAVLGGSALLSETRDTSCPLAIKPLLDLARERAPLCRAAYPPAT